MNPVLGLTPHGPIATHDTILPWADPLDKREWIVREVPHREAREFIAQHHYARGAANTSVARYGLYHREGADLLGAIMYMPPPGQAGKTLHPSNPKAVLSLSRLALAPECPKNAASFLISQTVKVLPEKHEVIATWADTARGHVGTIYQAANWRYRGTTRPAPMYRDENGVMVSKKRGPRNLSHEELLGMGCELVGRFVRHKYVLYRHDLHAHPDRPYPKREARLFPAPH